VPYYGKFHKKSQLFIYHENKQRIATKANNTFFNDPLLSVHRGIKGYLDAI
jgi:hypothetical protein